MTNQDTNPSKGQDWPLLTPKQQGQFEAMERLGAQDNHRDALISRALMLCPLPYRRTEAFQVVRETRLPGGTITTILNRLDDKIVLPYGDDAFVLDMLSNIARRRKSPEISTDNLADLMRLLGLEDVGGEDYKRFMARISRISAFGLRVKRRGDGAVNTRVVDIDSSDGWSDRDLRLERQGARRIVPRVLRLSPEYFADLMAQYAAMPVEILGAFSGNPTQYSVSKWLWWRADVSGTEALIDWEELLAERGSTDSNVQRFKVKLRAVLAIMATARPEVAGLFSVESRGLRVTPLNSLKSLD